MMPNPKIIIFYASYGDGHIQVSKALLSYFQENGIYNVQLIDLWADAHPLMDAISRFIYLKSTSYCPKLYGWSYYLTYNMKQDQKLMKWLNSLYLRKLKEIIDREKPDAIIHTFPMLSISELNKDTGVNIPTFTVLTDYVLHGRWVHPGMDKYFVATEELKYKLIQKGVPNEHIKVSGIPIRKVFHETMDMEAIRQRYGLIPGKKYILIMAGAYGVMSILKKMILVLLSLKDVQIILVCGRNIGLQSKLEAFLKDEPKACVLGFVEQIQELMATSSCIITKAGGITLSEALALQLPIIVFRPVPGQEKENAIYLSEQKRIFIAQQITEIESIVQQLLVVNGERNHLKQTLSSTPNRAAAEIVVSDVLEGIAKQRSLSNQKNTKEIPAWGKRNRLNSYEA